VTTRIARTPASAVRDRPTLLPEESSQRAARIAVDMAVMNTQYFITLNQFISDGEMFQLQMHLLYTLIDTMGVTAGVDPRTVLDLAAKHFKSLERERREYETHQQPTDR
jgi:hypothetical protein